MAFKFYQEKSKLLAKFPVVNIDTMIAFILVLSGEVMHNYSYVLEVTIIYACGHVHYTQSTYVPAHQKRWT